VPVSPKHKISIPDKAPTWGASDSLGVKLERALTRFMQETFTWAVDALIDTLEAAIDRGFRILAPGMMRVFEPLFRFVEGEPAAPQVYKDFIAKVKTEQGEFQVVAGVVAIIPIVVGILLGIMAPIFNLAAHKVDQVARSGLADPFNLLVMLRRGGLSDADATKFLSLAGIPNEIIAGYKVAALNLLSVQDAASAWLRGEWSEAQFDSFLKETGFKDTDHAVVKKLSFQLPGIGDLITMMVRDAFDDTVVAQYGYDENLPGQALELGKQIGLEPAWVKRYWRSHWNLPSPTQGFEMYQRQVIDQGGLETLLRIADYPPFWRDKLRQIAFSPFTRVDIRRMYQARILNETQVLRAYQDIGYDVEHAQSLTAFTILQSSETEKDLTRADVLGAYGDDIYTRSETQAALDKLGYDPAEAALLLARADADKAKALQKETEAAVKTDFVAGTISEAEAISQLAAAGVSEARIKSLLATWRKSRETRAAKPTQAQMARFYSAGLATQADYEEALKAAGYDDQAITWFVADATPAGQAVEARVLSASQVISAFIADTLPESDARSRLALSGLAETEVAVLMDKAAADKAAKQAREVATLTRLQFVNALIDDGQARSALGAAGYVTLEIDALLAEWTRARLSRTTAQAVATKRELSKADALNLYKLGQLTRPEALVSLTVAGYSAEDAALLMAGADAQLAERAASNAIDLARAQYLNGQIDRAGAANVLAGGGLTSAEVASRLAEWDRSLELRQVRLTQAQALGLLKHGIIDANGYGAYLRILGYTGDEYELLLAQAGAALEEGA